MASSRDDLWFQSQPAEHLQGTKIEVACAREPRDIGTPLDQHRGDPLLAQQEGKGQAGATSAHNQNRDAFLSYHRVTPSLMQLLTTFPGASQGPARVDRAGSGAGWPKRSGVDGRHTSPVPRPAGAAERHGGLGHGDHGVVSAAGDDSVHPTTPSLTSASTARLPAAVWAAGGVGTRDPGAG